MKRKRVGIAMSGGVDSTVCALLLKNNYDIEGFFMHLAQPDFYFQKKQVQNIAAHIDIDLHVIDLRRQFEEKILSYVSASYFDGLTPNPCMLCNREIKFGLFLETMLEAGMDCIATGHYARVEEKKGLQHLYKGRDTTKDQSYFLARLSQEQLARVHFPLGGMTKEETYVMAEQNSFTGFRGRESQDVCFFGPEGLNGFLAQRLGNVSEPGPIKTREGRELGFHKGLFHYTVGQRRGLGLPDSTPWYVLEIKTKENTLVVGKEQELYQDRIITTEMHWLSGEPPIKERGYQVKIRYTHRGDDAIIKRVDDKRYQITFTKMQRAVTPGQFAVIYRDDEVIGSGEIIGYNKDNPNNKAPKTINIFDTKSAA